MDTLVTTFECIKITPFNDPEDPNIINYDKNSNELESSLDNDNNNSKDESKDSSFVPMEPNAILKLVQIHPVPGKGNCMFTKKYVSAGDVIFVESPLFVILPDMYKDLWEILTAIHAEHQLELSPIWHLATLVTLIYGGIEKRKKMLLKWAPEVKSIHPDTIRVVEKIGALKNRNENEHKQMLYEYQRLIQMWPCNAFGHSMHDEGLLLYECMSYVSHSCDPSCCWHHSGEGDFVLRARRHLVPGDEITISYLSEYDLLCSVDVRRHKLTNWAFVCECERCILPIDYSRGFICSNCQIGTVYIQNGTSSKCNSCHSKLSAEQVAECLKFDEDYKNRIISINKNDYKDVMQVYERAQDIFKQHWIIYTLESYMYEYYLNNSMSDRIVQMQINRIDYIERALGGATYTSAFIFEELGDSIATSIGVDFEKTPIGTIDEYSKCMMSKYYYRSAALLQVLCGSNHDYFISVYTKMNLVRSA